MWVMDPSSVFVYKGNGLLICPPSPWWSSRKLDVLYHLQVSLLWLRGLLCWSSSYNDFYLSKWGTWWLFYLFFQFLIFMISSQKIPQFFLPDKILYLLLQVIALVCIMPMVFVEAAILILITFVRIFLHLQGRVMLTFSWRRNCLFAISILLFSRSSLLWKRALFRMTWKVCFHSFCSLPLLGNDHILYIHETLG